MGVDIRYSLPPHVSIEMLNQTISRIIGSPIKYEGNGDSNLPASESNPWTPKLIKEYSKCLKFDYYNKPNSISNSKEKLADIFNVKEDELLKNINIGSFTLGMEAGAIKATNIVCDPSSDHFFHLGTGRAILPSSNLFWASIYTRVTEMFGGKLLYADSSDEQDPKNYLYISEEDCLFKPAKEGESSESIKNRYFNALKQVKSIDDELLNHLVKNYGFSKKDGDDRVFELLKLSVLRFEEELLFAIPENENIVRRVQKF